MWIPCEKQLPNEDEIIWNGIGINGERKISDRVLTIDSTGFIRCGYFMKSCKIHKYCGSGKRNRYSDYGQASWEFGEHYQNDPKNWIVSCDADIIGWMPLEQPEPSAEIQEILNYLDSTLHPILSPDNWNVYSELHDMISMLPSAGHGRWIKGQYMNDIDSCLYNEYTCSICGTKELHKYPYCRNCGAKMDEVEE